jgi:hypothetical protein
MNKQMFIPIFLNYTINLINIPSYPLLSRSNHPDLIKLTISVHNDSQGFLELIQTLKIKFTRCLFPPNLCSSGDCKLWRHTLSTASPLCQALL